MRINLKRLTDAVPKLMELEFIAEDTAILISTTINMQQAEDLFENLRKALTAHYNDLKGSGMTATIPSKPNNYYGLPSDAFTKVLANIDANRIIDAIKLVREVTNLGLKEAKDVVDSIREKVLKGEI